MRAGSLAVAGVFLLAAATASAQPPPEPPALPGGTDISQPLQPVQNPLPAPVAGQPPAIPPPLEFRPPAGFTEIVPKPGVEVPQRHKLGGWWDSDQLLIWWPKAHPLPPLVTATRSGAPPVLGPADTTVLIGNRALANQDIAGYRTVLGFSLDHEDTVGIEGSYFFLGTRTLTAWATDVTNPRYKAIGVPYINALTGAEDVLPIGQPGVRSGLVNVFTTTRVQGAEANVVGNLYAGERLKLHGLVGYRFLQVHEGLRVEETTLDYPSAANGWLKTLGMVADQFDAHNRFHGGQIGLHADMGRGPFYVETAGKVAFGSTFEVVIVSGETHLLASGPNPLPILGAYYGGVYSSPSNIGRLTRSAFAVVPEGTIKIGLRGEYSRFFVGYNFLYLSNAVRPGDQVDRTLNPTQIPFLNGGGVASGPDRPRATINTADFWVQGLIVGLEGRY